MQAVVADYLRTPFHRAHKGELALVRPEDMASSVVKAIISRSRVEINDIEDLLLGCAYPEGVQGLNLGRMTTYLSGMPNSVPGVTTNRLCGSSMQVVHTAAGAIKMGSGDLFVCAGVETMSLVQRGGWNRDLHPTIEHEFPEAYISMGLTAENLANKYSISRNAQEEFSFHSHRKALKAQEMGYLDDEIIKLETASGVVEKDGCIRQTTMEQMSNLNPAFIPNGSVTAATSSPLTDGAACNLVCSSKYASENSMDTLAEIVSTAVVGVPPEIMGIGPVKAAQKALDRAQLKLDDIGVIELNEAFSAQSIAVLQDMNLSPDDDRLNIDGGAIAIGHPLGASGARLIGKSASLLSRLDCEYALAAMCIGGGMGIATIMRRHG